MRIKMKENVLFRASAFCPGDDLAVRAGRAFVSVGSGARIFDALDVRAEPAAHWDIFSRARLVPLFRKAVGRLELPCVLEFAAATGLIEERYPSAHAHEFDEGAFLRITVHILPLRAFPV